ncbi:hypothetical protein [Bradyrhizobium sp.]|jgi:hypothetical protein|uniref:hypothetical protein n=1 Tax=Bradyrhizobium sp. TaxID=376 RepID=UPI002E03B4C6|nr:hypothetical protein [Bradyrhizobium sp.]
MAKSAKAPPGKGEAPPDPSRTDAFANWLTKQPREWSVAIAARAGLRVVPLARGTGDVSMVLQVFRATAIARFDAIYQNRPVEAAAAAAAAYASVVSASASSSATSAAADAAVAAAARAAATSASRASASRAASRTAAADAAHVAAASAYAAYTDDAYAAIKHDAQRLHGGLLTAEQLGRDQLWRVSAPAKFVQAWQRLVVELHALGGHWRVWTDWYQNISLRAPRPDITEAEDAAFTDIPGALPWNKGAEVVNTEIALRLAKLLESSAFEPPILAPKLDFEVQKTSTIARLAEVASPQPSITDKGQLTAGPNQPFDVPIVDDDLSTLPVRQRNLVKVILGDLPENVPRHLKSSLHSYDEELKARGAQPILGLLKDDADIIAAAVSASHAEDEWLEPGMRKALDRFADNHALFVEHFPLDAEREAIYAQTPLNEEQATGKKLIEPFEVVAKAAQQAHKAGATTDEFMAVIDRMTEFARVVSTQPPAIPLNKQGSPAAEIKISPEDRIQTVTMKKRVILGALGFFERTYHLIGSTLSIAAAGYAGIAEALKPAIEILSRLLR